jgi:hypothetical protein
MIAPKTHPSWSGLINGSIKHPFKVVSGSLLVSRLSREYRGNPTPQRLSSSIDEVAQFFTKYEGLFEADLRTLFQ